MENTSIPAKRIWAGLVAMQLLAAATSFAAVEFLPSLKVGSEVHSNLTVTTVTPTTPSVSG